MQGKELDDPVVINGIAGSMAGTFTAVFVCPLDVLKTRLQVQASHHAHYRSITGARCSFVPQSDPWRPDLSRLGLALEWLLEDSASSGRQRARLSGRPGGLSTFRSVISHLTKLTSHDMPFDVAVA